MDRTIATVAAPREEEVDAPVGDAVPAEGEDGEGLQFGEGDMPFEKIIPILNKFENKSFAIEVWKGHEQKGKGFGEFLDKIKEVGLIVK